MVQRAYFRKSSIFLVLIGLCTIVFTFFVVWNIFSKITNIVQDDVLQQAHDKLNLAFLLVNLEYENYINGLCDQPTAQQKVKSILETFFYGPENLDYFWILSEDGVIVAHPYLKEHVNKHYTEVDDVLFRKTVEAILQAVKEGRSYVEYEFYKYNIERVEQKTSAIKVFKPWGWIIGTGYYKSTLATKIKEIQGAFVVALVIFLVLIAALYIGFLIQYASSNRQISKLLQQTRQEADRLRTLIETMPEPVALFGKDGNLIDYNRAYSDIQNFEQGTTEKGCLESKNFEVAIKTPDGLKYYVVHCVPVLDQKSNKEGAIHLYNDVTEQKLQIIFWQDMARQDPLTKVANRNTLEELIDSFPKLGDEFSIVMMDIDGFKMINDRYGHLVGDRVLSYFAEVIKNSIRKDIFFIRYGGDEFLLIMPQSTKEVAKNLIERLRKNFKTPLDADGEEIVISFSAGIATFPKDGKNLRELIERADKALYAAKFSGKNLTGS